jgi:hypothetical protein
LIQETQKDNGQKDAQNGHKKNKKENHNNNYECDDVGDFNRYINKLNKIADKCEIFQKISSILGEK